MKRTLKNIVIVLLLIAIDQSIKIIIYNNFMDKKIDIIAPILGFLPMINDKFSWINSISNMGVNLITHVILNIALLLTASVVFDFIKHKYKPNKYVDNLFVFLLAGGYCSLIDKIAWGGSLDYIWLKGFFIFDLKDVYISVFVGLVILGVILYYKSLEKLNEKEMMKELFIFIRTRYFKR